MSQTQTKTRAMIDFMGKRKLAMVFSFLLIIISIGSLVTKGLSLGIDFTGGYLRWNSRAFARQMKANMAHDTRGRLQRVDVPTLIMVGRHDELTPPSAARAGSPRCGSITVPSRERAR